MELASKLSQETILRKKYILMTSILVWCGFVVISSLYITIPMIPIFSKTFNVSMTQASWVTSGFSFAYAVGFLLFAPLSERFGKKSLMLTGLLALVVISPIIGFQSNLPLIVLFRIIQGLAASTFAPAVLSYVVEMFPVKKRVTTIGFVSTGFLMAGILGQVYSSFISQTFGWTIVFFILGGIYLFSAILLAICIPNGEVQQKQVRVLDSFKQMGSLLVDRNLCLCYLISITLLLSFVGMYTTLGDYLSQNEFALTNNQILMIRAIGLIGMLLSPFAGFLVTKFGVRTVLQIGLMLAMVGISLIGVSNQLPIIKITSVVFVTGISITIPSLISLIGSLGGSNRGIAVSLYTFLLFVGATLGPILALTLLKTGSYVLTFEVFACLLCIGFIFSFFIKNK